MKKLKIYRTRPDIGILILRISLGGLMLFHGVDKITNGIDFIYESLSIKGLPLIIANGVYIGELIVPLAILFGFYVRFSSFIFSINMLFSIWLIYFEKAMTLTQHGGWIIELNVMFLLGGVTLFFTGGGKYSIEKLLNIRNKTLKDN
ncbi:DoxX family protein [Chryseobacterium cucumeris]|uniref:DoxX family protein n=1 Tax=Chryseobacterium cucumeris TaxID=1813611 RepID=UPI00320A7B04